jgi:hypothetical protein
MQDSMAIKPKEGPDRLSAAKQTEPYAFLFVFRTEQAYLSADHS